MSTTNSPRSRAAPRIAASSWVSVAVPDTNALYGFVIDRLTERREVADVNTSIVYEHVRRPVLEQIGS
jgi:hypothetical protein